MSRMQQGRGGTGDLGRSVCGPGPQTVCGVGCVPDAAG